MGRLAALILVAMVVVPKSVLAQQPGTASVTPEADLVAMGRRIYREGILPSGEALHGLAQANVTRVGADAACAACHRRSGNGSSEGTLEIRPITGPALFGKKEVAPVVVQTATEETNLTPADAARAKAAALHNARRAALAGTRQRPPYDDTSLARAITEGIDVTGRKMNLGMPRFILDPAALESLTAYLKTLSAQAVPGVTDDKIHFATVIQPGTDAAQSSAMLDVLQTFIKDRNAGMRTEIRREQAGSVRLGRIFREWVLHVWELNGPSETWGHQLEDYDKAQPVYALVSGLGNASWRPIHEFSERFEVPCIFPQVDVPVVDERGYYTVYLSKGMALEADALAKFLLDQGERGPITQVFRRDDASTAGADAFRKAWTIGAGSALVERVLDETPGKSFWRQLASETPQSTLVLWLPPRDLAEAQALIGAGSQVKAIYLSSSLSAGKRTSLAADGNGRVRLVYPQDLPAVSEARLNTVRLWLRSKGIAAAEEKVQMNAYLAMMVTAGVVSHKMDTFSRDYLLEGVEHIVGNTVAPSLYPYLSLGPGQRFASKGTYVVEVGGEKDGQLKAVSDWIVP